MIRMKFEDPPEPPSEILPGQLYVGPHQLPGTLPMFDVVIGVAKERRINAWDHPNAMVVHVPLVDDGPPSPEDQKLARETANLVHDHIEAGRRVYVSCLAGINRSCWVVALTLKKRGLTGKDAIKLIRQQRGSIALTNDFFVALINRT
jgi:protein-tyrosine phosphatase